MEHLASLKTRRFNVDATLTDADDERHGENRRESPRGRKHAAAGISARMERKDKHAQRR